MDTYNILQHYWWLLVSLLGGILVFLLFVQGGQSLLYTLGHNEQERRTLTNTTGRKWELTFTTLVVFGGAAFAAFPLFYSTTFGGAYWVWMLILFCFVIQAVSYEYQAKKGNFLGTTTYRIFLMINGIGGPLLLGTAVGTFFNGAQFIVSKEQLTDTIAPVISTWATPWHGLEAVAVVWNVLLGLAVLFLARTLALLYFVNTLGEADLVARCRKRLLPEAIIFLVCFLAFLIHLLLQDGFAVDADTGVVFMQANKYWLNLVQQPVVLILLLIGVIGVLVGILRTLLSQCSRDGIWWSGAGTVLAVLALLLLAGWNNTAFYPSVADLQSSLTIRNASSSLFTLRVMAYVSILIPFVLAYIVYAWRAINNKPITHEEIEQAHHAY